MLIDCDTCVARGHACRDCVITVLLGRPGLPRRTRRRGARAIDVLAEAGLVPPLRLVPDVRPERVDIA